MKVDTSKTIRQYAEFIKRVRDSALQNIRCTLSDWDSANGAVFVVEVPGGSKDRLADLEGHYPEAVVTSRMRDTTLVIGFELDEYAFALLIWRTTRSFVQDYMGADCSSQIIEEVTFARVIELGDVLRAWDATEVTCQNEPIATAISRTQSANALARLEARVAKSEEEIRRINRRQCP